jgi:PAT family beta-lactamase induction signal transducer AmpG
LIPKKIIRNQYSLKKNKDLVLFKKEEIFLMLKENPLIFLIAIFINLGDVFISPLTTIYYHDCGFNYLQIANIAKIGGSGCFLLGTIIATSLIKKSNILKILIISTLLHALSLMLLGLLKTSQSNEYLFMILVFLKNTTLGCKSISSGGFFVQYMCGQKHKTIFYSLVNFLKSFGLIFSMYSGYYYEHIGSGALFIFDGMLVLPSLLLLILLYIKTQEISYYKSSISI